MNPDERLKRIKEAHANKVRQQITGPAPAFTPDQVAAHLARIEAEEVAHGQAQFARRVADFEAFAKKHPPGSLKCSPSTNRPA